MAPKVLKIQFYFSVCMGVCQRVSMYVCLGVETRGDKKKTLKVISFTCTCLHTYVCAPVCLRLPEPLTT